MANKLQTSIRAYAADNIQIKRFLRVEDAQQLFHIEEEVLLIVALSADALYQLPRTTLIHQKKMEDYMKHLYKVPNTSKYVHKKYVRIGEGSITYSIGHHRFIEMARAAGAVYKINEGNRKLRNKGFIEYRYHSECWKDIQLLDWRNANPFTK